VDVRGLARGLRLSEGLSARQIGERLGVPARTVGHWLADLPKPAWTRRPNAKDALRARAVELRQRGWSVPDIARELAVSRSTAWLWVKDLPLDPDGERARAGAKRRAAAVRRSWARRHEVTDTRRCSVHGAAAEAVGRLDDRDLVTIGALMYWCEGAKAKPWAGASERVSFTNSDPGLILIFLRFLDVLGVPTASRRFRVSIHETADADAAVGWWARLVGVEATTFQRTALKRSKPVTVRRNTGECYRGCLVVSVLGSRQLYWVIDGIVSEVVRQCRTDSSPSGVSAFPRARTVS
jgi:transposase